MKNKPFEYLKLLLRSDKEIMLLKINEFIDLLQNNWDQNLDNNSSSFHKSRLIKNLKKLKKLKTVENHNSDLYEKLVDFFSNKLRSYNSKFQIKEKKEKSQRNDSSNKTKGPILNEKRMRTLNNVFLHYCKQKIPVDNSIVQINENKKSDPSHLNMATFFLFLNDFKLVNEVLSKQVKQAYNFHFFFYFINLYEF